MTRYQVYYRKIDNSDEIKIAVINAVTVPSAMNKFEQMYDGCVIIDILEIQDEN